MEAGSVRLYKDGGIKLVFIMLMSELRIFSLGTAPGRTMTFTVGWTSEGSPMTPR